MGTTTASLGQGAHFLSAPWSCGQRSLTRIGELGALCELMAQRAGDPKAVQLAGRAQDFLKTAKLAADRTRPPWGWFGAFIDTIETNIHAAICLMLRYMPLEDLRGWLPEFNTVIRAHLPPQDPRRVAMEEILQRVQNEEKRAQPGEERRSLDESKRETVVTAVHAALEAQEREYVRVRSFRNIVYGVTVCLTVLAVALGTIMAANPRLAPLCFEPEKQFVCPTASEPKVTPGEPGSAQSTLASTQLAPDPVFKRLAGRADYFVIELVGLIAAAVASAAALRQLRGTSVPYSIPLALALLKLPTGALTAVLGLLLMRGEFLPGLSALDTSAQIIAWAIVFGYAQQLFTRLVDERGQSILNAVGGAEHGTLMDQRMTPTAPGGNA
ncbi:MAG: hypothetical protein ACJ8AT_06840 [Hyalangium sp.]|uniref:hypothetical protein n=1 Tax=Hyalangium sp. TaxID=2028555 RepID=UPI00389AC7D7